MTENAQLGALFSEKQQKLLLFSSVEAGGTYNVKLVFKKRCLIINAATYLSENCRSKQQILCTPCTLTGELVFVVRTPSCELMVGDG